MGTSLILNQSFPLGYTNLYCCCIQSFSCGAIESKNVLRVLCSEVGVKKIFVAYSNFIFIVFLFCQYILQWWSLMTSATDQCPQTMILKTTQFPSIQRTFLKQKRQAIIDSSDNGDSNAQRPEYIQY